MSLTSFGVRFFILSATLFMCWYLYTIYGALSQTAVMTLSTGKRYVVHPDLLVSSGVGKGEIGTSATYTHHSLVNPEHKTALMAPSPDDADLVIGIALPDGSACAYSRSLLLWHQVINDTVGNTRIVITVCPFTDTATCFVASLHGDVIYFGVSGMLYVGSLVIYDRATHSSWSAVEGRALVGPMSGFKLEQLAVMVVPWQQWRSLYPDTSVVSGGDDGTDYTFDPYCKLYMHPEHNLYGTLFSDHRLAAKTPVVGVVVGNTTVAYCVEKICSLGHIQDVINGVPVLVTSCGLPWQEGAYPVVVFDRRVNGSKLSFVVKDGHFEDTQTHSVWNNQGYAYKGPLTGTSLKRLPVTCTTWFTWSLFYPNTRIY